MTEGNMSNNETTTPTDAAPALVHTMRLAEAAKFLGVHPETARKWVRTKGLPAVKPGHHLLFDPLELAVWHRQQAVLRNKVLP
jgi:excisionase family DNA binding protein